MMDGETSQNTVTGGMFDDDFLSGFDIPEEAGTEGAETEASAEAQPKQGAEEPEEAAQDQADFLTVRFNKEDKRLTRAQAVEFAQKGMNYDHVKAELDSYRDGPIGKAIKAYADQAGMSVEKYAEMMSAQAEAAAEKKAIEELEQKWPGAPEDLLREYAKKMISDNKAQAASAEEARRQREWAEALSEYPDITPKTIPQEVHDAVKQGKTPLMALHEYTIRKLREDMTSLRSAQEAKAKQDDNRAKSVGSLAGNPTKGKNSDADDIIAGLNYQQY